jgi:beta-lactamase regulating signal transducer with metallopeptidase domain
MGNHSSHEHAPGATHEAVVHDPEHDIDARSATLWVVGGTLVTFFSLWIMLPIFERVQHEDRKHKVDELPAVELNDVREAQQEFLNGANPTKRKLDQVLKDLAAGK